MAKVKNKAPETQLPQEQAFSVYIGPSLRNGVTRGQIFQMSRKEAISSIPRVISKYPAVANLIVEGKDLPDARIRVKQENSLLRKYYDQLAKSQQ
jgi:hypothetical protein